jgi:hypothetical protein
MVGHSHHLPCVIEIDHKMMPIKNSALSKSNEDAPPHSNPQYCLPSRCSNKIKMFLNKFQVGF